jgi:hypothetical protein
MKLKHTHFSGKASTLSFFRRKYNFFARGLLIALMMDAANTSETLLNFYQSMRCHIPEDSHPQTSSSLYIYLRFSTIDIICPRHSFVLRTVFFRILRVGAVKNKPTAPLRVVRGD